MLLFYLLSLLLCVYDSQQQRQGYYKEKYHSWWNAEDSYKRLTELMRSYYEEAHVRTTHLNPIRFMYEESPYYEMGYITGEIIERYRKVLEHTQRPVRFLAMTLFDILKRVELVQKLYFEIYHLVRMLHETPRKWAGVLEFNEIESIAGFDLAISKLSGKETGQKASALDLAQLFAIQNRLKEQAKLRARAKIKLRREYQKMRQAYLKNLIEPSKIVKTYNKWWEIDYGWEIDYDWDLENPLAEWELPVG